MSNEEWLEEEIKIRLKDYVASDRENEVNDKLWTVKEVMFYYGEWIENEEVAVDIMKGIKRRISGFYKITFTHRMNMVRDLLRYEWKIKDIPAVIGYRRLK